MAVDIAAKLETVAHMLDGQVKEAAPQGGPAICVQGYISGFPCRLEAISPDWPFGVSYSINTEIMPQNLVGQDVFSVTITPRIGKGLLGFIAKLVFFEATGIKVQDKNLQKLFIFNSADRFTLERFLEVPGISEILIKLHDVSFNEFKIISKAGLYLSTAKPFSKLDLGTCRETFKLLAEIGQVLFDGF